MRRSCVAVTFLALFFLVIMTACGGSAPIAVTIASPSSTSIPAGSSAVNLTASVAHDSKSGGVTWSLSPANGCGALSNTTTTSATYTPPANTITADCTATITATSADDTTKTTTLTLTMKAITVTVSSSAGSTTTFGSGAGAVTLTATLNNEAAGVTTDSVTWKLASALQESAISRKSRAVHPDTAASSCGTLVPNATNPEQAVFTPASSLPSNCTATITATGSINGNLATTIYTVNAIVVALTAPTSAVTQYADKGPVALAATITNDGANKGLNWTLTNPGCGALSAATGTSLNYIPPSAPAAQCTTQVTATSATDPSKYQTTPVITINPTIVVTLPAPPATLNEGATQALTVTIANDLSNGGASWSLSPSTCGTLSATTGTTVTYTAGPSLAANCTAAIKVSSVTDSTQSATASIAVMATGVSITSPTTPQQVMNSSVTPITAAITADGSGQGISWAISPSTCGSLSATSGLTVNYTAPSETSLDSSGACTAMITASSKYDSAKAAAPVSITANPITVSPISSPGITFPLTVGQGSAAVPLSATVSYDPNGGADLAWSVNACGSIVYTNVGTNGSSVNFVPVASVPSNCVATVEVNSATDFSRISRVQITVTPLTVSIAPANPPTVNEGGTQQLTATVLGDAAGKGVNWTLTPTAPANSCGTLSASSSASGAAITFTAPSGVPSCSATATATSVTDGTKSASVTLNVAQLPISVSFTSSGPFNLAPSLPSTNETQVLNVTVTNDINSAGVNWGYTGCGSLGSQTTTQATYTAPQSSTVTGTCTATVTATSKADPTKSAVANVTVNPLTVSISPSGTQNITENNTANFIANVSNDIANGGVTWNLQPAVQGTTCGSLSSTTSASGVAVTYTAPATACSVLIQAFSVSDNMKSASDQLNIAPMSTLTFNTSNLQIVQGMVNMPFGTNVTYNNALSGGAQPYSFSYTGLPTWASFDQNGNITGTPTSAAVSTVTVTVKDNSSPQQTAQATFALPVVAQTVGTNNSKMTGQYACLVHEIRDTPVTVNGNNLYVDAVVFAFAVDGNGNITGGEADSNNPSKGYQSNTANGSLTGTYGVGADNRGYILLANSGKTMHWALAAGVLDSNGLLSEFRFTEMDDVGTSPSGKHGGGLCFKQYNANGTAVTSSNNTLSGETLSGGHVYALNGESGQGQVANQVGYLNTTGTTLNGEMDMVEGSSVNNSTFTGTIGAADSWGRIVLTAGPTGQTGNPTVLYISNQALGQSLLMGANPHNANGNNDLWFGQGRKQNATNIAAAYPITGPFVMYLSGLDSSGTDFKAMVLQGSGSTSAASFTPNALVVNKAGTIQINGQPTGSAIAYN